MTARRSTAGSRTATPAPRTAATTVMTATTTATSRSVATKPWKNSGIRKVEIPVLKLVVYPLRTLGRCRERDRRQCCGNTRNRKTSGRVYRGHPLPNFRLGILSGDGFLNDGSRSSDRFRLGEAVRGSSVEVGVSTLSSRSPLFAFGRTVRQRVS